MGAILLLNYMWFRIAMSDWLAKSSHIAARSRVANQKLAFLSPKVELGGVSKLCLKAPWHGILQLLSSTCIV